MRFSRSLTVPAFLVTLSCRQGERRPVRAPSPSLAGTWHAVEFVNPRAADSIHRWPLGRMPHAYLVYDGTGHVFFQAVSGLAANPDARGHWSAVDSAALRELLASASAYFGTYVVDAGAGSVLHRIEGEIPPNLGTTEIATPYEFRGDTLILGRDSSAHWRFVRVRAVSPSNDVTARRSRRPHE